MGEEQEYNTKNNKINRRPMLKYNFRILTPSGKPVSPMLSFCI